MIREATPLDMDGVEQTYSALLAHEQIHGSSTNWVPGVYPTRATAEAACKAGALYVLEEQGEICASVILNHTQSEDYRKIPWLYPAEDEEALVIHTLCIPPEKAGRGYGKAMVRYAVNLARETGCKVIRLDTWIGNKPAAALYQGLGFRYAGAGEVLFQDRIPETLVFFELLLEDPQ